MRRLFPLALVVAIAALSGAQEGDPQKELATALTRFNQALPKYPAEVRKDAEFLRGLLKDYYTNRDELTASEAEVAEALRDDLGLGAFKTRGGFGDMYKGSKPAAAPVKTAPVKTSGGGGFGGMYKGGKKAPMVKEPVVKTPPPKPSPRVAKISGLRSKPTFASGSNPLPGGNAVGYVTLSMEGRKKRIVEVPGTRGMDAGKRAATIATRLRRVAAADALWWMKLRTGTENGEWVLRVPGTGVGHILTADKAFAKEWGSTPEELAKRLRGKIRSAYDSVGATAFASRALGGDGRDKAIEARQKGDELVETKPDDARASYLEAIDQDATYLVPYLRLADLYTKQGKADDAKAILEQAASADGMSDEDKATARAAIKG